jgi:hypothetical protein
MSKIDEIMAQVDIYIESVCDTILNGNGHSISDDESKLRAIIEDALKVPDGWQLVPIEPADDMLDAACISQAGHINTTFKEWADNHSQSVKHESKNDR